MVDKVDDNHNEVLRGAAEKNSQDKKYDLRVKSGSELQIDDADITALLFTQRVLLKNILDELKTLNCHMSIINGEEIED